MAYGAGRPAPGAQLLTTQRLALTPLDPAADAADLHEMLRDPRVHRFDPDARASGSVAETERRLSLQVMANGGLTWAVRLSAAGPAGAAGAAIGTIGLVGESGTAIRGIGWSLAASYWRRGIMSEAARVVEPFLLARDGVAGLEAWVDSRNVASLRVAQAAGMSERARLPRMYGEYAAQTVVLVRSAQPLDPAVFAVTATLAVVDVAAAVRLLTQVLGLHLAWEVVGPPAMAFLAIEPWSGSPGVRLVRLPELRESGRPPGGNVDQFPAIAGKREGDGEGEVEPGTAPLFEVGLSLDLVVERVRTAGMSVLDAPMRQPWGRSEMSFALPDGTVVRVSGWSPPLAVTLDP